MVSGLALGLLIIGGAILLFDVGGIRTKVSAATNTTNPPAISSITKILGFSDGSITGTEIIPQTAIPPTRLTREQLLAGDFNFDLFRTFAR